MTGGGERSTQRLIVLHSVDALSALAAEEAVLEAVDSERSDPAWFLWTAPERCAVLGTSRPAAGDLFLDRLAGDGIPFWRRRSGGGTVLLGPESPVITRVERLARPGAGSIRESYADYCEALTAAMTRLGISAHFEPPADLACGGRKIAGLAQRRRRRSALVGACVLARPLAAPCARYLRQPSPADSPSYRAGRDHAAFMTSLEEAGLADPAASLLKAVQEELLSRGAVQSSMDPAETARAEVIADELAAPDWRRRF